MKGSEKKYNILVVEDTENVAEMIEQGLSTLGYNITGLINNGHDAITEATKSSPDLILMDIMLKGKIDGLQAAQEIRKNLNIPIVFVTGRSDAETLKQAKITNPFGYVLKPFKLRELHIAIEIALLKHQMENDLQESKSWLSTTINSIGEGIIAVDCDENIKFINPVAEALTGWKRQDALGRSINDIFHVKNTTNSGSDNKRISIDFANSDGTLVSDCFLLSKNGNETPVEFRSSPIKDDNKATFGAVIVFKDITNRKKHENALKRSYNELEQRVAERTADLAKANQELKLEIVERKQVERALRASEERYRILFNQAQDAILLEDSSKKILDANLAATKLLGYSYPELLSMKSSDFKTSSLDIPSKNNQSINPDFDFEKPFETMTIHKDGTQIQVELAISSLVAGGDTLFLSIARDITKRKRMENRLAKLNQCFLQFGNDPLTNINSLVAACGELMEAKFALYMNLEKENLNALGKWKAPDDFIQVSKAEGQISYDVIWKAEDRPFVIPNLDKTIYAKTDPAVMNYNLKTYVGQAVKFYDKCSGALCVIYQKNVTIGNDDQWLMGVIASAIAIEEERKRAENKIKAQLEEKNVLLKEIHHRVKNNMQVVSSLLNLQSSFIKDKKAHNLLKDSQNRVRTMALIHEKLYQSKDLTRIDFADYIESFTSQLVQSFKDETNHISILHDFDNILLVIDTAIPCGLIINELLTNSLKHAFPDKKEGEITIVFKSDKSGNYNLTVKDNGVGLPENIDINHSDSLGLQLVNTLVDQIDGKLHVLSKNGLQFSIQFSESNPNNNV